MSEKTKKSKRGVHPNTLANLKKWQKGQSGNPKGRLPVGWTFAEIIRMEGDKEVPMEFLEEFGLLEYADRKLQWRHLVVMQAYRHAARGNPQFFTKIIEYIDGRVPLEVNFGVSEKLKAEAEKYGIDWRNNPALVAIIEADEALATRHGDNPASGEVGQA